MEHEEAIRFFDGGIPDWRIALSPQIPKRIVVQRLLKKFNSFKDQDRPKVLLLLGAGGEGKSTAILQTISSLVEAERKQLTIFWREDNSKELSVHDLRRLLPTEKRYVFATDDADLIAKSLQAIVKELARKRRGDVRFLLACRDTDWIAAHGRECDWGSYAEFKEESISGLEVKDALAIIQAWGRYGEDGLRELTGVDENEATRRLLEAATHEAAGGESAFFGAMLTVRIGEGLREHIKSLVGRLKDRPILGRDSLQLALAYIAAMHAEGLMFLSRPVLAEVLHCQIRELRPHILMPLGKEAAVTGAGQFIMTRHRAIARSIVEVLSDVYGYDIDELFVHMALAALDARSTDFIPDYKKWIYDLPKHFLTIGRKDLATRIGRRILEKDPADT